MTRWPLAVAAGIAAAGIFVLILIALAPWASESTADGAIQGDTTCSGGVDPQDSLEVLNNLADLPYAPCTEQSGDVDCDDALSPGDATAILAYLALGEAEAGGPGCPAIGEEMGSPTPTRTPTATTASATASASPSPTLTPTPSPTPTPTLSPQPTPPACTATGATPTLPPTPSATAPPVANSYSTASILSAAYLGAAADPNIELAMIPGRPNEAVIANQDGYIYRVAMDGSFQPTLWGDVRDRIDNGGEQGLLSLAFSPSFAEDCRVYVYYTPGSPSDTILARFLASPTDLNESSEEVLLGIPDFAANHNGGHIAFDSAGYLYLSLGDGGGGGDPNENGQNLSSLLGKVLRIDVSGTSGYAIPPGNPFADGNGGNADEIFAYGLRNPWRMTIDPVTDDVWLGDVGQGSWEEVDRVVEGGNYGWDCYEGNHPYESTGCSSDPNDFEFPRAEYSHADGQAVTGGVVYRGDDLPELYGWYVYGDFYSGRIWAVDTQGTAAPVLLLDATFNVASFTLLPDGEVAIVSYSDGVYRLAR
jgi:glucose/arabinose dehydrogenase